MGPHRRELGRCAAGRAGSGAGITWFADLRVQTNGTLVCPARMDGQVRYRYPRGRRRRVSDQSLITGRMLYHGAGPGLRDTGPRNRGLTGEQ
jgi:hypothetical protein